MSRLFASEDEARNAAGVTDGARRYLMGHAPDSEFAGGSRLSRLRAGREKITCLSLDCGSISGVGVESTCSHVVSGGVAAGGGGAG